MRTEGMKGGSSRRRTPRAAFVFLALFTLTLWAPSVSSAQSPAPERATVPTDLEAWYYILVEEPAPTVPDPVNPYGENTLHVGITAGKEESRTYITLDVTSLPTLFEVVEGTLTLPIDRDSATMNAESARVQVCLSAPPPKGEEGSFEEPPETDCKTRSPATYEAKPFPHLTADLSPFGEDLAFSGLAIMPSKRAEEKGDTWHVAFYGKKNKDENARPIKAELIYRKATTDVIFDDLSGGEEPGAFTGDSFDTASGPGTDIEGFSSAPGPDLAGGVGGASSGDVAQPQGAAAEPAELPQGLQLAGEREPTHTIVWALPLVLIAFAFYFGSALSREVVVRRFPSR